MKFERQDILQLSRAVCETMLDLPLGADQSELPDDGQRHATTYTEIHGAWDGVVALDCSSKVATQAAALMFSKTPDEVTSEDRRDAVLELANVVGGNIKAMLPETCTLSLPTIVDQGTLLTLFANGKLMLCVTVPTSGQEFTVTVLQMAA